MYAGRILYLLVHLKFLLTLESSQQIEDLWENLVRINHQCHRFISFSWNHGSSHHGGMGDQLESFYIALAVAIVVENATFIIPDGWGSNSIHMRENFNTRSSHGGYRGVFHEILGLPEFTNRSSLQHSILTEKAVSFDEVFLQPERFLLRPCDSVTLINYCGSETDQKSCTGRKITNLIHETVHPYLRYSWIHSDNNCNNNNLGLDEDKVNVVWHLRTGALCIRCDEVDYFERISSFLDDTLRGTNVRHLLVTQHHDERTKAILKAIKEDAILTRSATIEDPVCLFLKADIVIATGSSFPTAVSHFALPFRPILLVEENSKSKEYQESTVLPPEGAIKMVDGRVDQSVGEDIRWLLRSAGVLDRIGVGISNHSELEAAAAAAATTTSDGVLEVNYVHKGKGFEGVDDEAPPSCFAEPCGIFPMLANAFAADIYPTRMKFLQDQATVVVDKSIAESRWSRVRGARITVRSNIKIVVFSTWAGPEKLNSANLNHQRYCDSQGYEYRHFYYNTSGMEFPAMRMHDGMVRPISAWATVMAAQELLATEKYDYIFKVDLDCVFVNSSVRIESIIDPLEQYSLYSSSYGGRNFMPTQAWLMRANDYSRAFVEDWWSYHNKGACDDLAMEQGAFGFTLGTFTKASFGDNFTNFNCAGYCHTSRNWWVHYHCVLDYFTDNFGEGATFHHPEIFVYHVKDKEIYVSPDDGFSFGALDSLSKADFVRSIAGGLTIHPCKKSIYVDPSEVATHCSPNS